MNHDHRPRSSRGASASAPLAHEPRRKDELLACLSDLHAPVDVAVETWLDLLEDRR
ncbi:MAG: hypothetical protein AAF763_15495 [Pseudomonadota bacterium]